MLCNFLDSSLPSITTIKGLIKEFVLDIPEVPMEDNWFLSWCLLWKSKDNYAISVVMVICVIKVRIVSLLHDNVNLKLGLDLCYNLKKFSVSNIFMFHLLLFGLQNSLKLFLRSPTSECCFIPRLHYCLWTA